MILNKLKKINFSKAGHFFIKNVLLLIILFIILIITIGVYLCNSFVKELDNSSIEAVVNDANVLRSQSDGAFSQIEEQMRNLSMSDYVNIMLKKNMNAELYHDIYEKNVEEIKNSFGGLALLDNVYLYSKNREFIVSKKGTYNSLKMAGLNWLINYDYPERQTTEVIYNIKNATPILSFVYCIVNNENASGIFIADINLRDHIRFYSKNQTTAIVERNSNKIYYNSNYNLNNEIISELSSEKNGIFEYDRKYYIMVRRPSKYNNFDYVIIEEMDNYYKDRIKIYLSVVLILFLISILFAFVAYYLSKYTYKPISELAVLVDYPFSEKSKKYLESDVNTKKIADRMFFIVSNNERLKDELNTKMETLNYAQLKALQWQINPHFMFNTLNMLYYLSREETGSRVSNGIMSLSKLMRYCLKTDPMIVELNEEAGLAKEYIKIMKARLGNEFEVNWNLKEEQLCKNVVKMTLQPILENSFRYGFKNIDYKGVINICAEENDEFFDIFISDNGVGMSAEEIEKINLRLRKTPEITENHVGFSNVNSRIILNYGEKYGVYLSENSEGGLTVLLRFPK